MIMMRLTAFADELEREKAWQRTYDAMLRKARAGGSRGRVFWLPEHRDQRRGRPAIPRRARHRREPGGDHPADLPALGRGTRLQGDRQASERRAGALGVGTAGTVAIVGTVICPCSALPAPLSRRKCLEPDAKARYMGRIHQTDRPESGWIRRSAPDLRIVSEAEWDAAHARRTAARAIYLARRSSPRGRSRSCASPSRESRSRGSPHRASDLAPSCLRAAVLSCP
jgi:hypothetical protein